MIVSCDAAALEWRTLAMLSQDPVAITEIVNKEDAHTKNQATFNLPSRLIAKKYLFRTIYNRGQGYAFTLDPEFMHVSTSVDYWDEVGRKFYSKYAGINKVHERWGDLCLNKKPIVGPSGREWLIDPLTKYGKVNWTEITNYPVQGTGHDIMKVARVSMFNRRNKMKLPINFISTVHDSIVLDVPEKYVDDAVVLCYNVFSDLAANLSRLWKIDWNVPIDCEVEVGYNMKDMEGK